MEGQERRLKMIEMLRKADKPLSGMVLGKHFGISRQVVVQDVALLRVEGYDILATARGYILNEPTEHRYKKMFVVKHGPEALEDELNTVVDNGGIVRNVIITHSIYGDLVGDLMLQNRRDVKQFVQKVHKEQIKPLSALTEGVHIHTIEAHNEEDLIIIEEELKKKNYLVKD